MSGKYTEGHIPEGIVEYEEKLMEHPVVIVLFSYQIHAPFLSLNIKMHRLTVLCTFSLKGNDKTTTTTITTTFSSSVTTAPSCRSPFHCLQFTKHLRICLKDFLKTRFNFYPIVILKQLYKTMNHP